MVKKKDCEQFRFVGNPNRGMTSFLGPPCPTTKAWEILGDAGVKKLHEKLTEIRLQTILRNGAENWKTYEFCETEIMFDTVSNVFFQIGLTIDDMINEMKQEKKHITGLPDSKIKLPLILPKEYESDYKSLREEDHYIIAPWEGTENTNTIFFQEKKLYQE
jgi:hypothetical protein